MKPGKLIVVEGPENTGKTSLAHALAKALGEHGTSTDYMSFPGRGTASIGAMIYEWEQRGTVTAFPPSARQALHLAAHLDAITIRIKPTLAAGRWIVLDRFWWSMWAHGTAQGLSAVLLDHLIGAELDAWEETIPALILCTNRPAPFHEEKTPEWDAVLAAYERLLAGRGGAIPTILFESTTSLEERVALCLSRFRNLGLL